jgi:uncharacterized phiE125 gp8 family phage protein
MPLTLTQTVAPTEDPVTLAEAKLWARVDGTEDDQLITDLITAATHQIEFLLGRQLVNATYTLEIDRFPREVRPRSGVRIAQIQLPRAPLSSVTSVAYLDPSGVSQTLSTDVYTVDTGSEPGRVYLSADQSWPDIDAIANAVTITFVAGYGAATAVPEQYKTAVKMLVCHWYDYRAPVVPVAVNELPLALKSIIWANKVPEAA